jgi:hypothetical protein
MSGSPVAIRTIPDPIGGIEDDGDNAADGGSISAI